MLLCPKSGVVGYTDFIVVPSVCSTWILNQLRKLGSLINVAVFDDIATFCPSNNFAALICDDQCIPHSAPAMASVFPAHIRNACTILLDLHVTYTSKSLLANYGLIEFLKSQNAFVPAEVSLN